MSTTRDTVDRKRYQDVQVTTLLLDSVLPFRLFTLIDGEYLLYRRENLPFTQTQRAALLDHGIETLFVSPEEVEVFWGYLRKNIRSVIDDPDLDIDERSAHFLESSSSICRQVLRTPVSRHSVNTAHSLVIESLKFQKSGKRCLHSLMRHMEEQPEVYNHSLNVSTYGLALGRAFDFSQRELESFRTRSSLHGSRDDPDPARNLAQERAALLRRVGPDQAAPVDRARGPRAGPRDTRSRPAGRVQSP